MTLADVEAQIKQTLGITDEPAEAAPAEPEAPAAAGGADDAARGLHCTSVSFTLLSLILLSHSHGHAHTEAARAQLEDILRELHITKLDEGFDDIYIDEIVKGELPLDDIKQLIAMQFPPGGAAEDPAPDTPAAAAAAEDEGFPDLPDVPGSTGAAHTGADDDIDEAAFEEIQKRLAGINVAGAGSSSGAGAGAATAPAAGAGADASPDFDHMTEESFDALFPSTPSAKSTARPAVSSGGNVFPAAPTSSHTSSNSVFPAAPKASPTPSSSSSSSVFPAAPKAAPAPAPAGRNPFPAAPSSSSSSPTHSSVFPAAPQAGPARSSGVFPAAPQAQPRPAAQQPPHAPAPAPASVFPAAPGSAARHPDPATAAAQVQQLFQHYYPGQVPPAETVAYYVQQVAAGALTIEQVQDQIRAALQRYRSATQPTSPSTASAAAAPAAPAARSPAKPARPRYTLEDDGTPMTKEYAQGFVDWLYVRYCGGVTRGDVARKPQLVRELVSGNYSRKMACWTVQRSKEAIKYAEVKKAKRAKLVDYLGKAAKIVCPKHMPTQAEIAALVEQILDQEKTLDEVEAELAARA